MADQGNFARRRRLLVLCGIICIAVCEPSYGAGNAFDGAYTGKRVRTEGPPQLCVAEEDVSVTVTGQGQLLTFTNSALKKFTMGFDPAPDGTFDIIYDDISGTTVAIKGRITAESLDADVVNYSTKCEHHWHLTKKS